MPLILRVRSFESLPEKEFLEKSGKSVRLTRHSHSVKLGMFSVLNPRRDKQNGGQCFDCRTEKRSFTEPYDTLLFGFSICNIYWGEPLPL